MVKTITLGPKRYDWMLAHGLVEPKVEKPKRVREPKERIIKEPKEPKSNIYCPYKDALDYAVSMNSRVIKKEGR